MRTTSSFSSVGLRAFQLAAGNAFASLSGVIAANLLGNPSGIKCSRDADGLKLQLPEKAPGRHAIVAAALAVLAPCLLRAAEPVAAPRQMEHLGRGVVAVHRLFTLMHDPQYRLAVAWQNTGYNQPPHPSFYLDEAAALPPRPNIFTVRPAPAARTDSNP